MRARFVAFASGLVFGLGIIVSGMVDPAKVLAFLDIAGDWDPSLAFVMGGAIPVAAAGFMLARRRQRPVCDGRLVASVSRQGGTLVFVAAMLAGMVVFDLYQRLLSGSRR